nr:uncharacterized protein LOC115266424 [Aedes albopictus]XP_029734291.1 uncharacterized protein LOC115269610 [Aedes albopictus]
MADRSSRKPSKNSIIFKLDSGASDHLVNRQDVFAIYGKLRQSIAINVAKDGVTLEAKVAGTITGCSNRGMPLRMEDVLLVPELWDNLMSVKKLANAGVDVTFSGAVAVLKKDGKIIGTAQMKGGLYELEVKLEKPSARMCSSNPNNRRMEHLSQHGMAMLVRNDTVDGIKCELPRRTQRSSDVGRSMMVDSVDSVVDDHVDESCCSIIGA